jgi:glutamate-1-semialdehyde 2,1-aminomutase
VKPDEEQFDFFRREFESLIPPNSFDVHAHLSRSSKGCLSPAQIDSEERDLDWDAWRSSAGAWCGQLAPAAGLFFAYPQPSVNFHEANQFVVDQVRRHVDCHALMLIAPQDDPAEVEAQVATDQYAGFKPYHLFAARPDTLQSEIGEFLPEWAWEIADRRGRAIMLHLVRDRALADPANQKYIRAHCIAYPNARLILAHAARGFCARHTIEGIASLRGLENVYFDSSAICESPALSAILREFGTTRLMYGSDFPISQKRGRCVSVGDGFLWLGEDNVRTDEGRHPFTLVGIESLLALREACVAARLRDADLERIFRDNARQLLGIASAAPCGASQQLYQSAKKLIPGGTQLLSKRPEMYAPHHWPPYYREARGCEIVDLDGRQFCDMTTSGIGSCLLGYADNDVSGAVTRRVQLGSMSSLNSPEEVELAELLIELHPWAEQVRYCRTGGESMAAATRIARAATGRDLIAFCGYHGWADWYLAANLGSPGTVNDRSSDRLAGHLLPGLSPVGVPAGLRGTILPFAYNKIDELRRIASDHGDRLAAVVMEPFRSAEPTPGFLSEVRDICTRHGAVLVLDEITSGWRFGLGGMHLQFGLEPDIAVFAKAISNGFPMGAILGRRSVMEAAQNTFISSTYWTEAIGPTAALATIRKMRRTDVAAHVATIGRQLRVGWSELASSHGVPVGITGRDALLHIGFDAADATALGTLFTIRMLKHGILAGSSFYPSLAHESRHVERYLSAADAILPEISEAIRCGDASSRLEGGVRHSGFARLN